MSEPQQSLSLHSTNGEWIITKFADGTYEVKVYNDDQGRRTSYLLRPDRIKEEVNG